MLLNIQTNFAIPKNQMSFKANKKALYDISNVGIKEFFQRSKSSGADLGKRMPKQKININDKYQLMFDYLKSLRIGLYFKSAFDYKIQNRMKK